MSGLASLDLPRVTPMTCGRGKTSGQRVDLALLCKVGVGGSSPLVSTDRSPGRYHTRQSTVNSSMNDSHPVMPGCEAITPNGPGADGWMRRLSLVIPTRVRGGTVGDLFLKTRADVGGGRRPPSPTSARRVRRPHARDRRVRSGRQTCARRSRLVRSRGLTLRHTREGDEQDIWGRARVDDLIHYVRSLDERLPGGVRRDLARAADRCVHRERPFPYDHDRAPRMRVPT